MIRKLILIPVIVLAFHSLSIATTYYIASNGNNSSAGTSWGSAWRDITHLNDGTFHGGDTVFFGTGIWRGTTLNVIGGTYGDPTTYACSSFALTNGSGNYHFARLFGSNLISGWAQIGSGNTYIANASAPDTWATLFQGTSVIYRQLDSIGVNGAGKWWYGNGHIVAWVNGGIDPDNYNMEMTARTCVQMARGGTPPYGQSHVIFWGLSLMYAQGGTVTSVYNTDWACAYDSVFFEHCKIAYVGGPGGNNPSGIEVGRTFMNDNRHQYFNRFRADSIGEIYSWGAPGGNFIFPQQEETSHGCGFTFYDMINSVIDSCVFFGHFSHAQLYFKSGDMVLNDTVRYNKFNGSCANGIRFYANNKNVIVYGNTFINCGIQPGYYHLDPQSYKGPLVILNNTFYNIRSGSPFILNCADVEGHGASGLVYQSSVFKYNVAYYGGSGSLYNTLTPSGMHDPWTFEWPIGNVDSNMFYPASGSMTYRVASANRTWSQWQGLGIDVRSTSNVNPGLNNPAADDFSRPNAPTNPPEMYATYGGRLWTKFGAIQDTFPPPPPPPLAISNVRATNITHNTATIGWDTNLPATSQVDYGLTTGYGSSTTFDPNLVTSHAQAITGLTQSTTYHYRVRTRDGSGNQVVSGDYTFATLTPDVTPPTITNVIAGNITPSSATLSWTTNEAASSQVNYGLTAAYGQSSTLDPSLVTSHAVNITGLTANTLYHFRVRSRDAAGNEAIGTDNTFRTDTTWNMVLISRNIPVAVCGSYAGYSIVPINDGVINPRGGTGTTWASDQSATSPHWVELTFATPQVVRRSRLCWALNNANSTWMCSQQYIIQYWDNGTNSYVNAAVVNNSAVDSVTTTDFAPVTTVKIRYWQPANLGPPNYASILWLTELELYGLSAAADSIPPASIQDLNAIPSDNHGDVRLQWTAPGDDDGVGFASSYAIRYSQDPIDEANWANAAAEANPPIPANGGEGQIFIIMGLSEGAEYYLAMKTYDDAGNASGISNTPQSFASGIAQPMPCSTSVDSTAGTVTVFGYPVQSYYSVFYEFELDVSQAFNSPRIEPALLAGSLASATFDNIQGSIDYFWRCRAMASGNADSSEWSQIRNFSLSGGAEPVLANQNCLYPEEGAIVSTNMPAFSVRKPSSVDIIYFQVDDNSQFVSPAFSGPVSASESLVTWQSTEPLDHPGAYFWRASADGQIWTSPLSFTAVLDIHAFPNPYRAQDGNPEITFCNLPQDARVTIATISGKIVKTTDKIGTGSQWRWDLKNDDGQNVASGVYLYKVSYNNGANSGKVVVIR